MKKKTFIILACILLVYAFVAIHFHAYIPCLFHKVTGLYCPGCGITRMIVSMFKGEFYQAFRYNMVMFVLFPFFIFFIVDYLFSVIRKKDALFRKIPSIILYILIGILILFAVLRNIFPWLGPVNI